MGESTSAPSRASLVARATVPSDRYERLTSQDEPRRSSRANKGSNSDRWQEVLDSARHNIVNPESNAEDTATDVGTPQTDSPREAQDNNEDDRIRCVCGQVTEVEDEDKDFVQCDQCLVWQHNQCVGLPSEIPENQDYFCELCRPDLHEELLERLAISKQSKARADKKRKRPIDAQRTTGGFKSRTAGNIASSDDEEHTMDLSKRRRSSTVSDLTIVSEESDVRDAEARNRRASTKGKSAKAKNVSSGAKQKKAANKANSKVVKQTGPFQELSDIKDPERQKIASALIRLVGDTIKIATESEGFSLPADVSVERESRNLGLQIEFAMFDAHLDVRAKFRQLSFNLKDPKNPALRKSVLEKTLKPSDLVQMSSEDMANPELKAKTEALREESLKQSVLVQETGPRIRRTHKGEEYVEGPDAVVEEPSPAPARATPRSDHDSDSSESDDSLTSAGETADTSPEPPVKHRRERSDSNFDIKNVWTHIETPVDTESPPPLRRRESRATEYRDNDNDEDILGLLEGDQKSIQGHNYAAMTTIWDGQLLMPGVSDLNASGTLLGGPKTFEIDWLATLTACIRIDGRIPKPDASKYLCHQKYSQSKTVFALRLQPVTGQEDAFQVLYKYFTTKDRYGVIKPGKTRLRDGYIVPLAADAALPEFLTMLPSFNLPAQRADMLLAILVVEKSGPAATPIPVPPPIAQPSPPVIPASLPVQQRATTMQSVSPAVPTPPPFVVHQWQTPNTPYHAQQQQMSPARSQQLAGNSSIHPSQYQQPRLGATAFTMHPDRARQVMSPVAPPPPPHLDQNAQAVLMAFLRAHPEIASNQQVVSSPQLMARLLDEFVRNGGMMRR